MNLPNFLVVGAAKAGTTSLYKYLIQHPEIYLNPYKKELRFFSKMPGNFTGPGDEKVNNSITRNFIDYKKYFNDMNKETVAGDISPDYLYYYKETVQNIKKHLSDPKIIIGLRNPVDQAFSNYLNFVLARRESLTFEDALNASEERKEKNWEWAWQYVEIGMYYKQVQNYLKNFTNVKIYLFENLIKDPKYILKDLFQFLDVDSGFLPYNINERYNVSGIAKNKTIQTILTKPKYFPSPIRKLVKQLVTKEKLKKLKKLKNKLIIQNLEKPEMKQKTRIELISLYKENILQLQGLINRDLSHWLK